MIQVDKIRRVLSETAIFFRQEIRFCVRDRKLFLAELGLAIFIFCILVIFFFLSDSPFASAASGVRPVNISIDHSSEGPLLKAIVERLPKVSGAHLVDENKSEINPEEVDVVLKQESEKSIVCLVADSVESVTMRQRIRNMLERCRVEYLKEAAEKGLFPRETLTVFRVQTIHEKSSSGAEDLGFLTLIYFWLMRTLTVSASGILHSIGLDKKGHNFEPLLSAPVCRPAMILGRCLAALPVGLVGGSFWLVGGLAGIIVATVYLCFRPKTMALIKSGAYGAAASTVHLPGAESILIFFLTSVIASLICSAISMFVALKMKPDKPQILERLLVSAVLPVSPYFAMAPNLDLDWQNVYVPLLNLYLLLKAVLLGDSYSFSFLPIIFTESFFVMLLFLWLSCRELNLET